MKLGEYIFRDLEKNPYLLTLYTNLLKKYASVQFKIYDEIKIENNLKKCFTSVGILGIIDRQSGRRAETEH